MRAYLLTTGTIFAILAIAHVLRTIEEWPRLTGGDFGFLFEGPGIGLIATAVAVWAWRLLRESESARRSA